MYRSEIKMDRDKRWRSQMRGAKHLHGARGGLLNTRGLELREDVLRPVLCVISGYRCQYSTETEKKKKSTRGLKADHRSDVAAGSRGSEGCARLVVRQRRDELRM
jgi:hypothetical protein